MAIFNFLENFFFISLAITFGLLLLLVYHFKERMSLVEKKSDTMNEIITNVVKEMKSLRLAMIQQQQHNHFMAPHQMPPVHSGPVKHEPSSVINIPFTQPPIEYSINEYDTHELPPSKIVVSDESEYETDSDSDSESNTEVADNESESSEDESDSESDDEDSDSESESGDVEPLDIQEIVDISVDLDVVSSDEVPIDDAPIPLHEVKYEEELVSVPETILPERKMDDAFPAAPMIHLDVESIEPKDPKREVYRKMNINQLRTIAISAGLTQDTSKMKKNELIKLLEALEE
jgi:hypothetical protein